MTREEIQKRIDAKKDQIAKLERLYAKYSAENLEEKAIIDRFLETGDNKEYRAYLGSHNMWFGGDAWHRANELYDARITLAKYEKQLETEIAKEASINELPAILVEFKENLIERWDAYDVWKRESIKKDYEAKPNWSDRLAYRNWNYEMNHKWGAGWYDFMFLNEEQIHNANVHATKTIVLNLVNRVSEYTGKITDCSYLRIAQDNRGYSIINGLVIGEKGKARVESIGAGGYNIQRYHIRVLVKEVK